MNDKDKEAFENWFTSLDESHLNRVIKLNRGASQEAWQAACEYKQKEIDFLKDRNETNISKVYCINQVNDGLHILLKESMKILQDMVDDEWGTDHCDGFTMRAKELLDGGW